MFVLKIACFREKPWYTHVLVLEIGISKDKHTVMPHFVLKISLSKDKHTVKPHFLLKTGISKDKARPEVALVLETVVFQDKLSNVTSAGESAHINLLDILTQRNKLTRRNKIPSKRCVATWNHRICLNSCCDATFWASFVASRTSKTHTRYLAKTHSEILIKG